MTNNSSELGPVPSDWSVSTLGEAVLEMRNGTTAEQNTEGRGHAVTRIETIAAGKINYTRVRHVDAPETSLESYRLQTGDILLSHINSVAHIGKVALYDGKQPLFHGMNLMLLRLNPDKIDNALGYCILVSSKAKSFFEARCKKAVNQASLNRGDISALRIPLPPLPEQRKIAAILSSVDDAIEATQAVIDQLHVVKKAMMAELLTRGLPGRHTRFKQTEIGEVPEGWEIRSTGDSLLKLSVGVRYEKRTVQEHGAVPVLDQSQNQILGYHNNPPGICATAAQPVVTFANHTCAVRWMIAPFSVIQNVFPLRGAHGVRTRFLYYILQTRISSAGYKGHWPDLMETRTPVPSEDEQAEITSAFDTIETRIIRESESLAALQDCKSALSSALLTGEIRVKPDEAP